MGDQAENWRATGPNSEGETRPKNWRETGPKDRRATTQEMAGERTQAGGTGSCQELRGGAVAGFVLGQVPTHGHRASLKLDHVRAGASRTRARAGDKTVPEVERGLKVSEKRQALLWRTVEKPLVPSVQPKAAADRATSAPDQRGCRGGHKGRTKGVLIRKTQHGYV